MIFEIKIKIEKIYIGEKIIFLEFIFFYLLIPLMGHYNGPKKCYGVKLGGGAWGPPVAPSLNGSGSHSCI